jgi:hypothetical protein
MDYYHHFRVEPDDVPESGYFEKAEDKITSSVLYSVANSVTTTSTTTSISTTTTTTLPPNNTVETKY